MANYTVNNNNNNTNNTLRGFREKKIFEVRRLFDQSKVLRGTVENKK